MPVSTDHDARERLTKLEARMDSLASTDFVRNQIEPLTISLVKLEGSVQQLTHSVDAIAGDIRHLFAQHDKLLVDRSHHEDAEHIATVAKLEAERAKLEAERDAAKSHTIVTTIRDQWAPMGGFILLVSVLVTGLLEFIRWYLSTPIHH